MNYIVNEDLERINSALSREEKSKLQGNILITGAAGFLGFYLVNFFAVYSKELGIERIMCLDNFQVGCPKWLKDLEASGSVELYRFNIISDKIEDIPYAKEADFVIHMASIASPVFYRKYPLETLDANVWGLRRLLDFYCDKNLKGFVFFSSSEIYGDPDPSNIPTKENYRGFVDCQGPRACYDEAKRFGETLCYLYHEKYNLPISIIRPFNNYGPGMRLNDSRVPADFAQAVWQNRDIVMYSDGSPTRTFCYISDAITGYLKALLYASNGFEAFNIGMDKPEVSIRDLAEIYVTCGKEIFSYEGKASFEKSLEAEYLINNPNRRCPDISKARTILGFDPRVNVNEGVKRFLSYIKSSTEEDLIW